MARMIEKELKYPCFYCGPSGFFKKCFKGWGRDSSQWGKSETLQWDFFIGWWGAEEEGF